VVIAASAGSPDDDEDPATEDAATAEAPGLLPLPGADWKLEPLLGREAISFVSSLQAFSCAKCKKHGEQTLARNQQE